VEHQAQHGQWHKGNRHINDQALCFAAGRAGGNRFPKAGAVLPDDGQNGAELDNNFKNLAGFIVEIEQITRQNQVAGRRNAVRPSTMPRIRALNSRTVSMRGSLCARNQAVILASGTSGKLKRPPHESLAA